MRSAIAMIRARWIAARSYRLRMIFSVASLLVSIVPLYFVANALQPIMAMRRSRRRAGSTSASSSSG